MRQLFLLQQLLPPLSIQLLTPPKLVHMIAEVHAVCTS
jgi:hypothetical protein